MNKTILCTGAVFGLLSVVLGAFGSHGLKELITEDSLSSFNTGVTYQMYHALLLLVIGSISKISEKHKKMIYVFITTGIVLFSFSIYFLATNSLTSVNFKPIFFLTPIGGLLLIMGWVLLFYSALKNSK
ncbi:DUF423 domain-containing protein [Cellulophaga sp. HaHaR_3_176]|uniref:DUF423 domain-containing protein n=1 Tax=Cellulophaga sp. HaHaR_3_176 TaxID=1942464 RepID=UPI001C1F40B4|nr:DUF423 domain-containing protein [Cellulophaga sp. HaHaR_3_176]QWX83245.1 DUF423 domain-containing protein [Cellulophaga sp. HaHaR_3_176]